MRAAAAFDHGRRKVWLETKPRRRAGGFFFEVGGHAAVSFLAASRYPQHQAPRFVSGLWKWVFFWFCSWVPDRQLFGPF